MCILTWKIIKSYYYIIVENKASELGYNYLILYIISQIGTRHHDFRISFFCVTRDILGLIGVLNIPHLSVLVSRETLGPIGDLPQFFMSPATHLLSGKTRIVFKKSTHVILGDKPSGP